MSLPDPRRLGILALMILGTLGLAATPVLALWLASLLTQTEAPVAGPYAVTALVILAGTLSLCYALGNLVNRYNRASGYTRPPVRNPSSWASSPPQDPGNRVLGHMLLAAFAIAGAAGGVWFFVFAGSSI